MEKITTIVDDKANKELAKPTRILTWILAGIGGFCIGFISCSTSSLNHG